MWGPDVGVTVNSPETETVSESNTLIIATVVPIACVVLAAAIAIPIILHKKKNR